MGIESKYVIERSNWKVFINISMKCATRVKIFQQSKISEYFCSFFFLLQKKAILKKHRPWWVWVILSENWSWIGIESLLLRGQHPIKLSSSLLRFCCDLFFQNCQRANSDSRPFGKTPNRRWLHRQNSPLFFHIRQSTLLCLILSRFWIFGDSTKIVFLLFDFSMLSYSSHDEVISLGWIFCLRFNCILGFNHFWFFPSEKERFIWHLALTLWIQHQPNSSPISFDQLISSQGSIYSTFRPFYFS